MVAVWIMLAAGAGLALGALVGYLAAERRCAGTADAERRELAELTARVAAGRESVAERDAAIQQGRREAEALQGKLRDAEVRAARLETQLTEEREHLVEQKRLLAEAETRLKDAFAGVSQEALRQNNAAFLELAKSRFETMAKEAEGSLATKQEQMNKVVEPMKVLLDEYQKRLAEIERSRGEDKQHLTNLLASLRDSHVRLDTQTSQLVSALRRPTTRGRWGEITLRRLVEMAGMSSYCDFCEQQSVDGEDGGRLRPDMVVTLPNERRVVIDSKVVYDNFADGVNETDEQRRAECFRLHARAVRMRCNDLSLKAYQDQFAGTLEFVVMFLPGEAFLYAAVEQDPSLIEDALRNKVVVATPTTLIALLKAIEFGWRQQRVAESAAEIQRLGEQLHQRIGVFVEHFARLGKSLDGAADAYNDAMVSLERNLLTTTQRFEEHGVRSAKLVPLPDGIDTRLEKPGDRAAAAIARAAPPPPPPLGLTGEVEPSSADGPADSMDVSAA